MELENKIAYEYECFYLDQMRTSKENIFARSEEIETKKMLTKQLYVMAREADEKTNQLLCSQTNLLESFYRFYRDECCKNPTGEIKTILQEWLTYLARERVR